MFRRTTLFTPVPLQCWCAFETSGRCKRVHTREQHPESVSRRRVSEKRYICGRCGQCCRDSNNLNRHTESCHKWEEVTIGFGSKKRVLTGSRRCVALKRATKRASGHGWTREGTVPQERKKTHAHPVAGCFTLFETTTALDRHTGEVHGTCWKREKRQLVVCSTCEKPQEGVACFFLSRVFEARLACMRTIHESSERGSVLHSREHICSVLDMRGGQTTDTFRGIRHDRIVLRRLRIWLGVVYFEIRTK